MEDGRGKVEVEMIKDGKMGKIDVSMVKDAICLLVGCLTSSNRLVYLRDGSAQTNLRAATLR